MRKEQAVGPVLVAALLVSISASAESFDFRRAVADPEILNMFADLLAKAAYRPENLELAAFLTPDHHGRVNCLVWPPTARSREESYRGTIPLGTVAIVHTHPLIAAEPSKGDIAQARRIGLPIFVLTRWHVYVVDPTSGETVELIGGQNWGRKASSSGSAKCTEKWWQEPEAPGNRQASRNTGSY